VERMRISVPHCRCERSGCAPDPQSNINVPATPAAANTSTTVGEHALGVQLMDIAGGFADLFQPLLRQIDGPPRAPGTWQTVSVVLDLLISMLAASSLPVSLDPCLSIWAAWRLKSLPSAA
jgi:hypothetical protein